MSEDEASWVVTTYLVSNAIALTASSFLARWLGRKSFFLICLALFTVSSVLCGFAWNLQSLLFFRILQGLGGGGMVPVSQSILADAFPPAKRGEGFALFGVAVVVAPVVGPTLGGWLADNYSWHWCFLINGPVGLLAIAVIALLLRDAAAAVAERRRQLLEAGGFDVVGFALVATFLGALEIVLDRGLVDDWFASRFIVTSAVISAIGSAALPCSPKPNALGSHPGNGWSFFRPSAQNSISICWARPITSVQCCQSSSVGTAPLVFVSSAMAPPYASLLRKRSSGGGAPRPTWP